MSSLENRRFSPFFIHQNSIRANDKEREREGEIWLLFFCIHVYRICGLLLASDNTFRFISCAMSKWFCLFRHRTEKPDCYFFFYAVDFFFFVRFLKETSKLIEYIVSVWRLALACVNHKIIHRMWNLFSYEFLQQITKPMHEQIPNVCFTIKFQFHQISVLASFFFLPFHTHTHTYTETHIFFIVCNLIL